MSVRVAIDIGGTFTDLVSLHGDGRISYTKSLTTYDNLARGVLDCVRKAQVNLPEFEFFIHGSTIAINTVIQKSGAVTGLITTQGFRDVYEIGRSNRPDAYNLAYQRPVPLIPRDFRYEVNERLGADGAVRAPLDEDAVRAAVRALKAKGAEGQGRCLDRRRLSARLCEPGARDPHRRNHPRGIPELLRLALASDPARIP